MKNNIMNGKIPLNELRFERIPFAENDRDEGWTIHRIDVYLKEELVGYLKIAYISKQNWFKYYNSGLDFVRKLEGWSCGIENNLHKKTIKAAAWHSFGDNKLNSAIDSMSQKDLLDLHKKIENHIQKRYGKRILLFKNNCVNKPRIDFIRIIQKEYKRKGIGTKLYLEGAQWMKEMGMCLRSSGLQSNEAKACWNKLCKSGYARRTKHNRFILRV